MIDLSFPFSSLPPTNLLLNVLNYSNITQTYTIKNVAKWASFNINFIVAEFFCLVFYFVLGLVTKLSS